MSGLVQGMKMGGPWLIPMVAVAAMVGLGHRGLAKRSEWLSELMRRGFLLMGTSLVMYCISTPYACE